jgi:hypothetical protein
LGAAAALALLAGCATVNLTNLTPSSLPQNASEIYTFTLRVQPKSNTIPPDSIAPRIIVDGQSFAMVPSPLGAGIYDFEYQVPPGRTAMTYYYLVDYRVEGNGQTSQAESTTGLAHLEIVRREVLSLASARGPVGAQIGVLGRGFTSQDVIYLDATPARTVFESPTSLSFFVPAVPSGHDYGVTLGGGGSPVATFRVDPTAITASPSSLSLASGEQQSLTFSIPNPAPQGGLLVDVATDVPESVIMPEVLIPEGQTSVTVSVQGGKPGNGNLVVKGAGPSGDLTIPVTVAGK